MLPRFFTILSFSFLTFFSLSAQQYFNEWIDFDRTYYKFTCSEDAWVKISFETLSAMGLPTAAGGYELMSGGEKIPLYVSTEGEMSTGDFIAFYGKQNDGKFDTQLYRQASWQPADDFSLFSDERAYFLSWTADNENAARFEMHESAANYSPELFYESIVRTTLHNVFHEGKTFSLSGFKSTMAEFDQGEGYVGIQISDKSFYFQYLVTPEAYTENGGAAKVSLKGLGKSNDIFVFNDHHLQVELNDQFCNSVIYEGENLMSSEFEIPVSQIELLSRFKFSSLGDLALEDDISTLYEVSVAYPRYYRFDEDESFSIYHTDKEAHHFRAFGLEQWAAPRLLDMDNHKIISPFENHGQQIFELEATESEAAYRSSHFVDLQSFDRELFTADFEERNFTNYSLVENQGDFILLTNKVLLGTELDQYRSYRASEAGGGFKVQQVLIDELVDQFALGIDKHPLSIRHFVNYAVDNWTTLPQHLFLVGKSLSYQSIRSSPSNECLVPTYGSPPSDFLLTTRDASSNIPQVAVGRLPVREKSQILNYLNKVIETESLSFEGCDLEERSWTKNIFHAVSGYSSQEANYFAGFLNDLIPIIEESKMGGEVLRTLIQNSEAIETQEDLPTLMDQGLSMISYMGHPTSSGTIYWNFDIDKPEKYSNQGRYPLINANSCFSGNIHYNGEPVMAEDYVLTANRGAIGYIAIVNFGFPTYMQPFNLALYREIGGNNYGGRVGKIIQNAYRTVYLDAAALPFDITPQLKQLHSLVYAGDPAVRLFSYEKPDYHVEHNLVTISPQTLNTDQESFLLKIEVKNTGRGVDGMLPIRVWRDLTDGSSHLVYDDAIAAPNSATSLTIPIFNTGLNFAGTNTFRVELDPENIVDELCDENNDSLSNYFVQDLSCTELEVSILNFPDLQCLDDLPFVLEADPPGGFFRIDNQLIGYHNVLEWGPGEHFIEYEYIDPVSQCAYSEFRSYEIQGAIEQAFFGSPKGCVGLSNVFGLEGTLIDDVSYRWEFGEGAEMQELLTPGPHSVIFDTPGPKPVRLYIEKNGCSFLQTVKQIIIESPMDPVSIAHLSSSGNTITIELEAESRVNFYNLYVNETATLVFVPEPTFVIEDLTPETIYNISIQPVGDFSTGNACGTVPASNELVTNTGTCPAIQVSVNGLESVYCTDNIEPVTISTLPFGGVITGESVEPVPNQDGYFTFSPALAGLGVFDISLKFTDPVSGCAFETQKQVSVVMNPQVEILGDTLICADGETTLFATNGMASYEWNADETETNAYAVGSAGNYELVATDNNGCADITSATVSENLNLSAPEIDLGPDKVNVVGDVKLSAGAAASYLWSTTETSPEIFVGPGTFHVTAYSQEGCAARDTVSVEGFLSGIELQTTVYTDVFPNPVESDLQIKSEQPITALRIMELDGAIIFSREIESIKAFSIPSQNLPKAMFLLGIEVNGNWEYHKLVRAGK